MARSVSSAKPALPVAPAFPITVADDIAATPPTNRYTDVSAPDTGHGYYRGAVQSTP